MNFLHVMIKPASSLCNLDCGYCFYRDEASKRNVASYGVMSIETMRSIVSRICSEVTREANFIFQGGEPLLAGLPFFEAFEQSIIDYARKGLLISRSVQTNATLINDEWAEFFARYGYLVGVSLDGPADLHNPERPFAGGKGSYSAVMSGIRKLEKFGVSYNVLTVVTEPVARRGTAVYGFMRKNHWDYMQFIPCIAPLNGGNSQLSLRSATYARFLCSVFDMYFDDIARGERVSVRWFDNIVSMLRGQPPESCGMTGVCACQLVIEADGSAYPCDFYAMDEYRLGNLSDMSIEALMKSEPAQRFIKASRAIPEKCRTCPVYPVCRNGCRRYRTPYIGETPAINVLCEAYRVFFDKNIDRLLALAKFNRLAR